MLHLLENGTELEKPESAAAEVTSDDQSWYFMGKYGWLYAKRVYR